LRGHQKGYEDSRPEAQEQDIGSQETGEQAGQCQGKVLG